MLVTLTTVLIVLLIALAVYLWRDDPQVGAAVGAKVGEHHYLVTHITTDPSWSPVIPATPEP